MLSEAQTAHCKGTKLRLSLILNTASVVLS